MLLGAKILARGRLETARSIVRPPYDCSYVKVLSGDVNL